MGKTMRTVRFPEPDGSMREQQRPEVDSRWRADRDERLRRADRDAKRIERAERHTDRMNDDLALPVGSTVRTVLDGAAGVGGSGDHCQLKTIYGVPCAVHFDCDDYPDGTITNVLTGRVVNA